MARTRSRALSSYDKNPAKAGEFVTFYANGLGPVNNQPASGDPAPGGPNLATTKNTATLTIGGKSVQVLFSGLAPDYPRACTRSMRPYRRD